MSNSYIADFKNNIKNIESMYTKLNNHVVKYLKSEILDINRMLDSNFKTFPESTREQQIQDIHYYMDQLETTVREAESTRTDKLGSFDMYQHIKALRYCLHSKVVSSKKTRYRPPNYRYAIDDDTYCIFAGRSWDKNTLFANDVYTTIKDDSIIIDFTDVFDVWDNSWYAIENILNEKCSIESTFKFGTFKIYPYITYSDYNVVVYCRIEIYAGSDIRSSVWIQSLVDRFFNDAIAVIKNGVCSNILLHDMCNTVI